MLFMRFIEPQVNRAPLQDTAALAGHCGLEQMQFMSCILPVRSRSILSAPRAKNRAHCTRVCTAARRF